MDYITEHLDEYEREKVRLHLMQCSDCQNHLNDLKAAQEALQNTQTEMPNSAYYSTILPRVQKRLMDNRHPLLVESKIATRFILPLAVSALSLLLLLRLPLDSSSEHEQVNDLFRVVKDYSADELVQAVSNEYSGSNALWNPEAVSEGIAEHMRGDRFIREALLKHMESSGIIEMDIDEILSELNHEQGEQLLSGLSEREML